MTQREQQSMVAHKQFLDAYYDLPLSTREAIGTGLDKALGLNFKALKQYRTDVRAEINSGIVESKVNHRFTPQLIEDGETVII